MRTLEDLRQQMLGDAAFRRLYERECHVCSTTMRIVERMTQQGLDQQQIADELGVAVRLLHQLADADHCEPALVQRLCRRLGLPAPQACPRLEAQTAPE